MNRYEMEPILNPIGRFVIYGDHLNAIEELEARVAELEAGRSDLIATIEAMNEENAQLAHRLWCLENPE